MKDSKWTHSVCESCWKTMNPNRVPVRAFEGDLEVCCFCGQGTKSGIYLRADNLGLKCAQ